MDKIDMSKIDIEKPEISENEILCSGCWKVSGKEKAFGKWKIYTFEYLAPIILCQECQLKEQKDIKTKQDFGL